MRAVIQRVKEAKVEIDGHPVASIGPGLLVLLGVGHDDTVDEAEWLAEKIVNLRVFDDGDGRINRSLLDVGGEMLAVSQFTLYWECRRGRRPDFSAAARPEQALPIYRAFCAAARRYGAALAEGEFGAYMEVTLINDGPVTVMLESGKGTDARAETPGLKRSGQPGR